MQAFVVLGETFYYVANQIGSAEPAAQQWVVGIYPDEIAAKAIVDELKPLAEEVMSTNAAMRDLIYQHGDEENPEDGPLWDALADAMKALREKDPETFALDYDPDDGDTVGIRYRILPGQFKQHF